MCSLHPRISKKYREVLEDIRTRLNLEATDSDIMAIKALKRRAIDDFHAIKECIKAEQITAAMNGPTPAPRNLPQVQFHVDNLLKVLRT